MSSSVWGLRLSAAEHQFLEEIARNTDGILSKTGVVRVLIRDAIESDWKPLKGVDGVGSLPTCRAGAGHQGTEDSQPTPQQPSPQTGSGDSAPTEVVRVAKKKVSADLVVPQCVYHHSDLIQEFWRGKKGSKSETAWKLLMTELEKIQDAHGDERVDEQLRLGINGKWTGISLRNLERFEKGNARATPQKMSLTEEARSLGLI